MCCSRKSIILLSKITNISYFTVSSLHRLRKSTSKKFYKNLLDHLKIVLVVDYVMVYKIREIVRISLTKQIKEFWITRRWFMARNCRMLIVFLIWSAECRPCERRLYSTISFKNVISETQKSLIKDSRSKWCPKVSPSVARSSVKVAAVESRRRSLALDFVNVSSSSDETRSATPLLMPMKVSQLFMNIIYQYVLYRN